MKVKNLLLSILGAFIALIFLSPFYIVVVNAFKSKKELFQSTLGLAKSLDFTNFIEAFKQLDFISVFFNSLVISVGSIIIIVIFSSMAAWMLERTKSKVSNFILFLFISSMLIPFQAVMLPLVRLMGKLHMLNIPGLMFIYLGFGSSLSIFFISRFYQRNT